MQRSRKRMVTAFRRGDDCTNRCPALQAQDAVHVLISSTAGMHRPEVCTPADLLVSTHGQLTWLTTAAAAAAAGAHLQHSLL